MFMEDNKTALVIGYEKSGQSAEKFLQAHGYEVLIWDDNNQRQNPDEDALAVVSLCVISPGVPYNHRIVKIMTEQDIPVVAEFELPFIFLRVRRPFTAVAVTGTNGKTTVVNQIHNSIMGSNKKSVLCGNVGIPTTSVADKVCGAISVMEVSSFMLEPPVRLFRPRVAVITNITQDHLERHGTMEEYIRCKKQIFARQTRRDYLVLNWDDENCRAVGREIAGRNSPKIIWYSTENRVRGFYYEDGIIYKNTRRRAKCVFPAAEINEFTRHGLSNALATVAVAHILRLNKSAVIAAAANKSRPHRIEKVGERGGLAFYNDSKATNISSVLAACKCFSLPITLILCGKTKGQNYIELFENLPPSVTNIIVFGECANSVFLTAKGLNRGAVFVAASMQDAVNTAAEKTAAPAVILFSPGGSSFDQFRNYEDRGEKFTEYVRSIINADDVGADAP
jgi:UDP-N-acetylmuramoylalanine--D-glutamate ligase